MDYKSTLNLPKTSFPMKADLPAREPEFLALWQRLGLYEAIRKARAGQAMFLLHDGPPYANGHIHIGHALNKILKDLIVRYKTMQVFDAPYVPGWDCHGMPIEHQLFKELKLAKHQIDQVSFLAKARVYADEFVGIQREEFKRLGVSGDWEQPYLTMAPDYELAILRVFRELVEAGYVYRGKKPVYWCATCETALAEAEVEYEDRQETSIYVAFPVISLGDDAPGELRQALERPTAVAVWTTTPWTLPANVALCAHPDADYVVLEHRGWPFRLIVAESLAGTVAARWGAESPTTVARVSGKALAGLKAQVPFGQGTSVGVTDGGVSMSEGTGIIHIAPGHGREDYAIGQRYKLETRSPVDAAGKFTNEVPKFAGRSVFEANAAIVADLRAQGRLLAEEPITHSYPHCWRCRQPVIFRATPQWFLNVEHQGLRGRLLKAIGSVDWIPPVGQNRMTGMLEHRPDWCLSRQRYWGTPIPVLHCAACDVPLMDAATLRQVEHTLAARGVEAWFTLSAKELAPSAACPKCRGTTLRKENDILDVWFDSGVSHEAVLKGREGLGWPADLYMEGSDQHRGRFQVSLIPAVALHGAPPYRGVLTHGFVMDGLGRKMSKSLGNVVAPQDVMQRYGADILRLWVASVDYREDVRISDGILAQVAETYRKLRNIFRFLLSNLHDYRPGRAPEGAPTELDRWALGRTRELREEVTRAYEACQFHEAVRAIYQYCVVDLSGFYLDALKDRLYTEAADSPRRRYAQISLYAILSQLVRLLAPILAVTTEEIWQRMHEEGWVQEPSVHLARWPQDPPAPPPLPPQDDARWKTFRGLREVVMKALEAERARQVIGSPLEARVTLVIGDRTLREHCETHRDTLAEAVVVSEGVVTADGAQTGGGGGEGRRGAGWGKGWI